MKKHSSVFALFIHSRIYNIIITMISMATIQITGFSLLGCSLGSRTGNIFLGSTFLAAYTACVLFCFYTGYKQSKTEYTLRRLRITELSVFLWDALTNTLFFLILSCAEIIVVCLLALRYQSSPDYNLGPQGIMMLFYKCNFLHAVIPMAHVMLWIRNTVFIICSGFLCACVSVGLRYRLRNSGCYLCMVLMAICFAAIDIGENCLYCFAFALCTAFIAVSMLKKADILRTRERSDIHEA
ncbi:MAG: hypothetical protein HUJ66_03810 [Oscillospiraceae bacterium]|nr:hypothetical protein [Oscillospiraceae bacterium]